MLSIGSWEIIRIFGQGRGNALAQVVNLGHPITLGMPDLLPVTLAIERRQTLLLGLRKRGYVEPSR